jgi:hypothetical protein
MAVEDELFERLAEVFQPHAGVTAGRQHQRLRLEVAGVEVTPRRSKRGRARPPGQKP